MERSGPGHTIDVGRAGQVRLLTGGAQASGAASSQNTVEKLVVEGRRMPLNDTVGS